MRAVIGLPAPGSHPRGAVGGAQVRNAVGDVQIQTMHDGHYRNERGHRQHDAQQREIAAQFVRPQGIHGDGQSFAKGYMRREVLFFRHWPPAIDHRWAKLGNTEEAYQRWIQS